MSMYHFTAATNCPAAFKTVNGAHKYAVNNDNTHFGNMPSKYLPPPKSRQPRLSSEENEKAQSQRICHINTLRK